ncbi:hypothetical protein FACS1894202_12650 [Clostridia bacterium]|nr:hypothetical protein FACS1894202_12650 [Clostridia bacterium]
MRKSVVSTAQDFVNVLDIRGNCLYTADGWEMAYIRLSPVSVDLMSEDEKIRFSRKLAANLGSEREPFKLLCVSRSVDISALTQEYADISRKLKEPILTDILSREARHISEKAISGNMNERQFYICVWRKGGDILKRVNDLAKKFEDGGVNCRILDEREIVRLCNMVTNPAYVHTEGLSEIKHSIPMIMEVS